MLDAQTAQFEQEAIVRNARFQKEMMTEIEEMHEIIAESSQTPAFTMKPYPEPTQSESGGLVCPLSCKEFENDK